MTGLVVVPRPARPTVDDLLLWSSGVLSLGVGDAAASVGGTLFGRTKIRGGKSLEGTACSVAAQVLFATALLHFGQSLVLCNLT